MGKHLDPLEKEFLIKRFKASPEMKLNDFCDAVGVSNTAFKKWLKQYDEQGIEGLARADAALGYVLPDGIDRTENERIKKNYTVKTLENGEQVYVHLKPKITK